MRKVDENSHHWSSIEMFLNWLNAIDDAMLQNEYTKKYIIEGFKNALKEGYDICKVPKKILKNKKSYTSIYECRNKISTKKKRT